MSAVEIVITPKGAKVLRAMIVSCGTAGCFAAIKKLEKVKKTVPLRQIGMDETDHWYMAAFSRLKDFAVSERLSHLDGPDVARYFGGKHHIEIMARIADHAGLGQYLGPAVGLVSHVLLPLSNGHYRNGDLSIDFDGHYQLLNPDEAGVPCYHLGVVVNLPLTEEEVRAILAEQADSAFFCEAVRSINGPIIPPDEYFEALGCTMKKAQQG